MYRGYEDPYELEQMLQEARENDDGSEESAQWIAELRERLNFAWQDDEE